MVMSTVRKGAYIMRQSIQRSISIVGIALVTLGLAMGATKTQRAKSEISVYGRVLEVDKKERTLLIADHWSKKRYLVTMPEGARLEIFFGIGRSYDHPTFEFVNKKDLVRVRCIQPSREHLARLDDGSQVVALTAAR
jgi:hypothetical protein